MEEKNFLNNFSEPINNLTNPLATGIGSSLEDIWFLTIGGPIELAANKRKMKYARRLEQFKIELEQQIKLIPAEHRTEPNFQIAAQALDDSKYCLECDELRAMIAKLLSKTMDSAVQNLLHPSFPDIIKQMNAYDAKLIATLKMIGSRVPLVDYISQYTDQERFDILQRNVLALPGLDRDLLRTSISISTLQRWGLLYVTTQQFIADEEAYTPFYDLPFYIQSLKNLSSDRKIKLEKGYCELTSFGLAFATCCVP